VKDVSKVSREGPRRCKATIWAVVALGLALLFLSSTAWANTEWTLVLPREDNGGASLESHRAVLERALRVEMQDMTPGGSKLGDADPGFFMVAVRRDGESMSVQVWDRGRSLGTRVVSASGPPPVWARRVALAVGELGRDSARRRELRLRRESAEAHKRERERAQAKAREQLEKPRLRAGIGALLLPDHAFLAGPVLGLVDRGAFPWQLELNASYAIGAPLAAQLGPGAPLWSALSVGLGVERAFQVDPRMLAGIGLDARALVVRGAGDVSFDGLPEQRSSFLILGGAHAKFSWLLDDRSAVSLRADAGPVLRGFTVTLDQQADRVRDYYVGLTACVEISAR
jgi:hypothetical protein